MELETLIEDLHAVAQVPGAIAAGGLTKATRLLELARYAHAENPLGLLEADIRRTVGRDLRDEHATYLTLYLCLSEDAPADLMQRYKAIESTLFRNLRLVRGELQARAVGGLAFQLYAIGTGLHRRQTHVLGLGIRNISHEWAVTQFEVPPRRELYRFETRFEATAPNQRFFAAGQSLYGSTVTRSPRAVSRGHRFVGTAPVDPGDPNGAVIHVFFLEEPLRLGRQETIIYEVDTRPPGRSSGSSLELTVVSPVESLTLRAFVPREMTDVYTTTDHDNTAPVGGEGTPVEIQRAPAAPLEFTVREPELNHRYELAWRDGTEPDE